jgi:hypothetical protein
VLKDALRARRRAAIGKRRWRGSPLEHEIALPARARTRVKAVARPKHRTTILRQAQTAWPPRPAAPPPQKTAAGPRREQLRQPGRQPGRRAEPVPRWLSQRSRCLAGSHAAALVLWAASSGFDMLLNINTVALRQAIVPPQLYGRVVSVAQVLAWSAIPLGSLAGAAAINLSGSVTGVYAVIGGLTAAFAAAFAFAFAFSPVAHGDRYLAEAAGRRAGSAGAGHPPGSRAAEREGAGHGPGSPGTGPAGRSAGAGQGTDGSKEAR